MATTDTIARISPYAERLLDDYIYDEIDDAGTKLRAAYRRVSKRPARAVDDPRVVRLVRDAGESIRKAAMAASGREPDPPRRLPRIVAALAITAITAAFVKRLASASDSGEQ